MWQALASVIVPGEKYHRKKYYIISHEKSSTGFTINRICAYSLAGMAKAIPHVAETSRKWATTGIGLGTIPFIVHPIDSLIHFVMDNTTRYQEKDNEMIHLPNYPSLL